MTKGSLEALSERERACLAYLDEAKKLGVSFSRYCREKELKLHEWSWVKRVLIRKGSPNRSWRSRLAVHRRLLPHDRVRSASIRCRFMAFPLSLV